MIVELNYSSSISNRCTILDTVTPHVRIVQNYIKMSSQTYRFGQVLGGSDTNNNTNINQTANNMNIAMNKQSTSVHIFDLDGAKPQFQSATEVEL